MLILSNTAQPTRTNPLTTSSPTQSPVQNREPEIFLRHGVLHIVAGSDVCDGKRICVRYGNRGCKVVAELIGEAGSGSYMVLFDAERVHCIRIDDEAGRLQVENATTLWVCD